MYNIYETHEEALKVALARFQESNAYAIIDDTEAYTILVNEFNDILGKHGVIAVVFEGPIDDANPSGSSWEEFYYPL